MGREKFKAEKKIEIIKAYKAGEVAYSQLGEVYGMNPNEIYRWISKFERHGEAAFRRGEGNAGYSKEFKQHCVEEYLSGEGSLDSITAKYNLPAKEMLRHWVMRYNANRELKDYDPKREVYMAEARRKTTLEERKEITDYADTCKDVQSCAKRFPPGGLHLISPYRRISFRVSRSTAVFL